MRTICTHDAEGLTITSSCPKISIKRRASFLARSGWPALYKNWPQHVCSLRKKGLQPAFCSKAAVDIPIFGSHWSTMHGINRETFCIMQISPFRYPSDYLGNRLLRNRHFLISIKTMVHQYNISFIINKQVAGTLLPRHGKNPYLQRATN